jgi:hypothetical protein
MISIGVAALLTAGTASAEEGFYAGVGLSYGHMKTELSLAPNFINSSDNYTSAAVIGGYRKQMGNQFWAAEAQLEFPINAELQSGGVACSTVASGPYGCDVDLVLRLRGVFGGEIGNGFELYGTAGFVLISGEGATSPTTTDSVVTGGVSVGLGLQKALTPTLKIRGEVNHDVAKIGINQASGGLNPPGCCDINFTQTSLQISLVKSF